MIRYLYAKGIYNSPRSNQCSLFIEDLPQRRQALFCKQCRMETESVGVDEMGVTDKRGRTESKNKARETGRNV